MSEKVASRSADLLSRRQRVVANGVGIFNTATVRSAKGAIIVDLDGNRLIDFAGGIGVVNAGHCPESVVRAITEQASRYLHTSFNVVTYEPYVELCELLTSILPHGTETKAMLVSTGAEAVENAIKIARQATGRQGVLCYNDAFHGRTLMAMTLTSKTAYKHNCGPFAPEVYRLPFPNTYRMAAGASPAEFARRELLRLEESCHSLVGAKNLAAVIIELVQGEGGFNVAPPEYVAGLRRFCDEHGIVLIFDEIQSGFGRTGQWAAWQNYGVTPDISTYAKSLGSGMPIAAILGRATLMDAARPGTIGGTFIGNPVCCAAALATIKFMAAEKLNDRGRALGKIITDRFLNMRNRHAEIGDVRGLGAMVAMELVNDGDPGSPAGELCARVVKTCARQGLVILSAGTHKNIIRVLCPLVISLEDLGRGLDILEGALAEEIKGVTA